MDDGEKIDALLKNIKVVDPAIGSGAFPVGMMGEIIKARANLTKLFPGHEQLERTLYNFKRECIEDSLYGVDIDPGAVDIAQLRLWLSLIVDETDIHKIKPLPNLDYKIMCGNSLLDEFEGVKLFDERLLGEARKENHLEIENIEGVLANLYQEFGEIQTGKKKDNGRSREIKEEIRKLKRKKQELLAGPKKKGIYGSLFEVEKIKESKKKLKEIEALHKQFFNENNRREKIELREKIEKLDWEFIEETLKEQGNEEAMNKLGQIKKTRSKPFFLWKLYFAEVFQRETPGFDVVIGNPPYGFRDVLTKEEKEYFRKTKEIDFGSGDSAELFCMRGLDNLTRDKGILTFIIPKKSLYGDSWEKLRINYWAEYTLRFVLDASKAFDQVLLEAAAFGLQKEKNQQTLIKSSYLTKDNRINEFASSKKEEILLENKTLQIYLSLYPKSLINKILSRKLGRSLVEGKLGLAIGREFYSDTKEEYKLLKGIDIEKWRVRSNRYLKNKDKLNWESAKQFMKPKVISQRIVAHIENPIPHIKLTVAFDKEGLIITNTLMSFELDSSINPKFWLAYLNSTFVSWYAYNLIYSRAIRGMDFYNFYIQQIPIPKDILKTHRQTPFIEIVDKILALTESEDYIKNQEKQTSVTALEKKIDEMIYDLYELTSKEIELIEDMRYF